MMGIDRKRARGCSDSSALPLKKAFAYSFTA
jgi:hypothetical protein